MGLKINPQVSQQTANSWEKWFHKCQFSAVIFRRKGLILLNISQKGGYFNIEVMIYNSDYTE